MLHELAAPSSRAIVSQFALILDHLTPHLGRGGAPALLVLCQRVALAGGAMTLSESDLLRLIGCSSSTLTAMKRLNDELGLLVRLPGESVRRRGPAPGRWMLALSLSSTSIAGAVSP